jgi:site-specific recombinase XerD
MYEAGVGIADIKEMLGHDDETETTIYIHISVDAVKRFLKKHIANSS